MIIAIFPTNKTPSRQLAKEIQQFLTQRNIKVVAEDEDAEEMGAVPMSQINPLEIDFLLSMGGDGTILHLVHKYEHLKAAVLGINLGHLGFMADVPLSDLYPSLQDLIQGAYRIEERVTIEGRLMQGGGRCFAVNDIVVHRGKNPSLVEIAIHVDGVYLNTFQADGIIIATPTGSTAYSLAAGGPILIPTLEALLLTPISPHTISNRPLVLTSTQEIQIQSLAAEPLEVRADGLVHYELRPKDIFRITRNAKNFRLVSLLRRDYFSTLRTKLGWAGKLR